MKKSTEVKITRLTPAEKQRPNLRKPFAQTGKGPVKRNTTRHRILLTHQFKSKVYKYMWFHCTCNLVRGSKIWSTQLVKSNFGYQSTDAKSQPVCIETNSITCVHVWDTLSFEIKAFLEEKVEKNILICQWLADGWGNNWSVRHWQIMIFCDNRVQMCFSIRSPSLFFNEYLWKAKWSTIFTQEQSKEGELHGFIYAWADCYLQPIYTVGRNCTWADHNL